ncbi:ADP-ribosylglycohydrolase family protein [Paratractidigestivibacter sp.]|uniref:ADP-ribosylglycohydrolase family protein n=1 Tax=Paratractidigestivibacter sp. TaxID=2847316 RepID=UPI002AC974A0|nr:ADP-ribosylglycohydrolase family protein [Paratractidigestivibacter sp.]
MVKYAPNKVHVNAIFDAIPAQLNKKNRRFKLSDLSKTARMERYESDLMWLADAGVALPCCNVSTPTVLLQINLQHNLFKLFLRDCGLLSAASVGAVQFDIIQGDLSINQGSFLENVVAQELLAHGFRLSYYNKSKVGEVDFVLQRGSFTCTGMEGHGTHNQPAGTWSDDTSMTLAICDSYRELGRIDADDIRKKFLAWYNDDACTCERLFDTGNAAATALRVGRGLSGERDNGNGSLMRTVPPAFTSAADDEVRAVSAITHAHRTSTEACVRMVQAARELIAGRSPREVAVARNDVNPDMTRFILATLAEPSVTKQMKGLWERNSSGNYVWTIEHIFPQGENIPSSWVKMIGGGDKDKAREIQAACVHTLGNLTLTGYNSNLGNLPFVEKRERKDSSGAYVGYRSGLNLNEDLVSTDSWTGEQIEARTAKLVELALQAFSFESVEL